jgi:cell division septal protein FtsQ
MSSLFFLRKNKKLQEIKKRPFRLLLNIIIGTAVLALIIYLMFQFIIKPNMEIKEVVISVSGAQIPFPEEIYQLGERLKGISFSEASPGALETAFSALDEILAAEVARSWNGKLSVSLYPRSAYFILETWSEKSSVIIRHIPVDQNGQPFSASDDYMQYFINRVPIIALSDQNDYKNEKWQASEGLLQTAGLLRKLQTADSETFSLITRVKYDNNSNQETASLFIAIAEAQIEFQFSHDLEFAQLLAYLQAVAGMADKRVGGYEFGVVSIYGNSAVCRL